MLSPPTLSEPQISYRDEAIEVCVSVSDDGVARLPGAPCCPGGPRDSVRCSRARPVGISCLACR